MSGKLDLSGWDAGVQRIRDQVYEGVSLTAHEIQRVAVIRAPIRKAFGSKHRPTRGDLASFKMKIGRADQYTGAQMTEAAAMLGIDLDASAQARVRAGRTPPALQVQSGRSGGANRLSFRGRRERRVVYGAVKFPRVTGRDLRQVFPVRVKTGSPPPAPSALLQRRLFTRPGTKPAPVTPVVAAKQKYKIVSFTPNSRRLKAQGQSLTARARYDIAHMRGVIRARNGQYQYGGFLRKNIVVEESKGDGLRVVVTVRSKAPYSRYVEFPTSRTAAQPFLQPALKGARSQFANNLRRGSA